MLKTSDGTQIKRISKIGDRQPALGGRKQRALYTATGGETSIDLSLLTPSLSYTPSANQISVKRTSGSGLIAGIDFYERTATSIGFPIADPLIAGEIVEIVLDFGITSVMALAPRSDCFSQTATTGQTLITADFSWTYNLNPSKAIGGVRVEINGITQTRGVDFSEVNLGTVNTSQVLLVDALLGGENLILTPAYQALDTSAASTSFYGQAYSNMQAAFTAGTQAFIDQSSDMISVPNTSIVNRAKIPNLANDLRASLGIDRVMPQAVMLLQTEFGSNGEPVYSAVNDDRGLIRFVGAWSEANAANGPTHLTQSIGSYVEVTFYGTGLNLLGLPHVATHVAPAYVDGVLVTANIFSSVTYGTSTYSRNYNPNAVVPVISGLTLGIHTVKIMQNDGVANLYVFGFEILNSNASGLVNINPGVGYINGQKYTNTLVDSVAYNTGMTGTKGGRVVRYLNSDGTFGQAFQATDASALYLSNAVHTNEEVARVYYWREFGCGRNTFNAGQANDDFSSLIASASDRAFTLDDGTTTLVGYQQSSATGEFLHQANINGFWTLTFIGTGLDFVRRDGGATIDSHELYIDGVLNTTFSGTGITNVRIQKVVSGLPYGTHTVKLKRTTNANNAIQVLQFIVYQPKKPSVPFSSIEICNYNVMADLVANSTAGIETISQGVLRKEISQREAVYVGAGWATPALYPTSAIGGWQTWTGTVGQYFEYTFFGTGFESRGYSTATCTVQVDGAFPAAVAYYGGFNGYTPGTGALTSSAAVVGSGFRVVGLPLGVHKVRVTLAAGTYIYTEALDIITPIHSYNSNLYADLQNTLPVGSNSLMDSRKTSMIKEALPAQKAWVQAVGIASGPTTVSTAAVPMPDMSVTIKTTGGALKIAYSALFKSDGTLYGFIMPYLNGAPVPGSAYIGTALASFIGQSGTIIVPVSAGVHQVALYWVSNSGATLTVNGTNRNLTVQEI